MGQAGSVFRRITRAAGICLARGVPFATGAAVLALSFGSLFGFAAAAGAAVAVAVACGSAGVIVLGWAALALTASTFVLTGAYITAAPYGFPPEAAVPAVWLLFVVHWWGSEKALRTDPGTLWADVHCWLRAEARAMRWAVAAIGAALSLATAAHFLGYGPLHAPSVGLLRFGAAAGLPAVLELLALRRSAS